MHGVCAGGGARGESALGCEILQSNTGDQTGCNWSVGFSKGSGQETVDESTFQISILMITIPMRPFLVGDKTDEMKAISQL